MEIISFPMVPMDEPDLLILQSLLWSLMYLDPWCGPGISIEKVYLSETKVQEFG